MRTPLLPMFAVLLLGMLIGFQNTDKGKSALRSLFELNDISKSEQTNLCFGPMQCPATQASGSKTVPGRSWSCTSVFMDPSSLRSMDRGSRAISKR